MMRSNMNWSLTMGNNGITAQGSATGASARGLWGRIVRMAAVAGTCAVVLTGIGIGAAAGAEKAPSSRYSEYQIKACPFY